MLQCEPLTSQIPQTRQLLEHVPYLLGHAKLSGIGETLAPNLKNPRNCGYPRVAESSNLPVCQSTNSPNPPLFCKVPNAPTRHNYAFGHQQSPLGEKVSTEAAQFSARGNYPVAWDRRVIAGAHDVAHGSMCARPSRSGGNIAVGGYAAVRDAPHDGPNAGFKTSHHWKIGFSHHPINNLQSANNLPTLPMVRQNTNLNPPPMCSPPTSTSTGVRPVGTKSFLPLV